MARALPLLLGAFALLSPMGCGPSSNFNQLFTDAKDKKSLDVLLEKAEVAYDQGKYADALTLIEKAYEINPHDESTMVLMGYIYLAQGNLAPFTIAKNMIKVNEKSSTSSSTSSSSTSTSSSSGTTDSAADSMQKLSAIISFTNDDYAKMGTPSSSANFTDLDIIIPEKPGNIDTADSPRHDVNTLKWINKAITVICPFVDSKMKVEGEARHNCTATEGPRNYPIKADFLWSLTHLTEALAFNSVLLYSGTSSGTNNGTANLLARVTKMDNKDYSNVLKYIEDFDDIKEAIDAVFDVSTDSMLTATLNDLTAVVNVFSSIEGIPESMTKGIVQGMNQLKETAKKISDTSSQASASAAQAKALRGQMNKQISDSISKQIDKTAALDETGFASQKTEVCKKFTDLSVGIPTEELKTPTACK